MRQLVHQKRFWVYTKLAEKEMLLRPGRRREFVDGEGFLYLGRSYRLRVVPVENGQAPLRLDHGWFLLDQRQQARAREHFIRWYVEHAEPWLRRRVSLFRDRIGVRPAGVNVRDLGSRWGSCSANRDLNFHWRTILLPPRVIEYLVVHELVHLHEPHHTPEFWRRLELAMPDFPSRKQWLAENGAAADL
jgi:predicted metal-dependent hydrolase